MKRLSLNLTVATLCFVAGLLAAESWGFVSPRERRKCGRAAISQPASPAPSPGLPYSSIRSVDFLNFTYSNDKAPVYPEALKKFRLIDGRYEYSPQWLITGRQSDITYADLTGDGEEEAIIKLLGISKPDGVNEPSGAGQFVYVYTMERGEPKFLGLFQTYGPTAADVGGIVGSCAYQGDLVLELYGKNRMRADGSTFDLLERCGECLEDFTRARFRWDGERFKLRKFKVHSS